MNNENTPPVLWKRAVLVLAALAVLSMGGYAVWDAGFRASDDDLWLYMASLKLDNKKLADEEKQLITLLKKKHYEKDNLKRVEMRAAYGENYLAALGFYRIGQFFVPVAEKDYPASMVSRMLAGFFASFAAAALLFAVILTGLNLRVGIAAVLGLVLCFTGLNGQAPDYILAAGQSIFSFTGQALINPGPAFSVFGFTPRNQFTLLVLAVFLLRWNGQRTASYLLLVPAMLFHQSQGGFILATLLFLDAIWKGFTAFRPRGIQAAILLMALLFLARESLWKEIGWEKLSLLLLFCTGAVFAAFQLGKHFALERLKDFRRWGNAHEVAADTLSLLAILVFLSATAFFAQYWLDTNAYNYFWGQLPTRFLGMVQPALAAGLMYHLIRKNLRWAITCILILTLLAAARLEYWPWKSDPQASALAQIRKYEAILQKNLPRSPSLYDEPLWYYALVRHADLNKPGLSQLLSD